MTTLTELILAVTADLRIDTDKTADASVSIVYLYAHDDLPNTLHSHCLAFIGDSKKKKEGINECVPGCAQIKW